MSPSQRRYRIVSMRLPIKAHDVLIAQRKVFAVINECDNPTVRPETDGVADGEINATIPVNDDQ